jgi:hypothetical protein
MSATPPAEFFTMMMTAVLGPGIGEMVPVIKIGWRSEYDGSSVWSVIEYVTACAGKSACVKMKESARTPDRRKALKEGVKLIRWSRLNSRNLRRVDGLGGFAERARLSECPKSQIFSEYHRNWHCESRIHVRDFPLHAR